MGSANAHDLSGILPTVTPATLVDATVPYLQPTVVGATLEVIPDDTCSACAKEGTTNHKTFFRWRLLDTGTGLQYFGATPWGNDEWVGPQWLRWAQSFLFYMSRYAYGWAGGVTVLVTAYVSSTAIVGGVQQITLDMETAFAGNTPTDFRFHPVMVGDRLTLESDYKDFTNNMAQNSDDRFQAMITAIIDPPGVSDPPPATITVEVNQAMIPAMASARIVGDPVTAIATISRSTDAQSQIWFPWFFPDHAFWGVKRERVWTSADPEWTTRQFFLTELVGAVETNARVALPDPDEVGDCRPIIVEARVTATGLYSDITASISNLQTWGGAGRFFTTEDPSTWLDLFGLDFTTYDRIRITYYYLSTPTDYANKAQIVGPRSCRHSLPDVGGTWGTQSGPNHTALGWSWYCNKFDTATGYGDYTPLCYQANTCDEFLPIAKGDMLNVSKLWTIFRELWMGGTGDRGLFSIMGAFLSTGQQTFANNHGGPLNEGDPWTPTEGGTFGRRVGGEFVQGVAFRNPTDGTNPEAPSVGALQYLLGTDSDVVKRSLLGRGALADPEDEYKDRKSVV